MCGINFKHWTFPHLWKVDFTVNYILDLLKSQADPNISESVLFKRGESK